MKKTVIFVEGQTELIFVREYLLKWFLGHYELFVRMDNRLTTAFIHQNLQIDLTTIDPETDVFHPYPVVGKIFGLVELSYKKRREDVNKIVGNFNRDDYQTLLDRDACQSFNQFHEAIHG